MKKHFSKIVLLFVALNVFSCKQNPYPNDGQLRVVQRQEQRQVEPPLALSVEDVIEFKEGRYREYMVRASVKDPGKPVVKIDNLPPGAEFDPATFILKWTPGFLMEMIQLILRSKVEFIL